MGASVELHRRHFEHEADDQVWLPEVCQKQWVIISHDQFNELEKHAIRNANGRAFLVVGGDATGEQKAALVTGAMRRKLRILKAVPAPFIVKV